MGRLLTLILLVLVGLPSISRSQDYSVFLRNYTSEDGLPTGFIGASFEDRNGFLWFGTLDGVVRFDGQQFKSIRVDTPAPSGFDIVKSFAQSPNGTIWVGTAGGLARFNSKSTTLEAVACETCPIRLETDMLMDLHASDKGVWMGSTQLDYLEIESSTVHSFHLDLPDGFYVGYVFESENEGVLFSVEPYVDSGLAMTSPPRVFTTTIESSADASKWKFTRIENATDILNLGDSIFVSTWGHGIHRLVTRSARLDKVSIPDLPSYVRDLQSLDENRIIITAAPSSEAALERWAGLVWTIDFNLNTVAPVLSKPGYGRNLSEFWLESILVDRFGTLWIGTNPDGILRANFQSPGLYLHKPNAAPNSVLSNFVRSLVTSDDGNVWIGTAKGLLVADQESKVPKSIFGDGAIREAYIEVLKQGSNSEVWAGTESGNLYRLTAGDRFVNSKLVSSVCAPNPLKLLEIDNTENSVWIQCGRMLGKLSREEISKGAWINDADDFGIFEGELSALHSPPESNTLFVGSTRGLWIMDESSGNSLSVRARILEKADISHIQPSAVHQSRFWISTYNLGIFEIDETGNTLEHLSTSDKTLPQNQILATYHLGRDELYSVTQSGILTLESDRTHFEIIDRAPDGSTFEINRRATVADQNGVILAGTLDGYLEFSPHEYPSSEPIPFVLPLPWSMEKGNEQQIFDSQQIPIFSSTPGRFVFDLAAIQTSSLGPITIEYRLQNVDSDWQRLGSESSSIIYSVQKSGEFNLFARARTSRSSWSEPERLASFVVKSPFWSTWWFVALSLTSLVSVLIVGYEIRMRVVKRRRKELENLVRVRTDDLTEALEKVNIQAGHLQVLNESKGLYLNYVSRELINLLNVSIIQFERFFKLNNKPSEYRQTYLDGISGLDQLRDLLGSLADLAAIESGSRQPEPHFFDVTETFRKRLPSIKRFASSSGTRFTVQITDDQVATYSDSRILFEAIETLALQVIKSGAPAGNVFLSLESDPASDGFVVTISEEGTPIKDSELPLVFDLPKQKRVRKLRMFPNLGIALSFAHRSVSLLGGKLQVSTKDGGATVYEISMPKMPAPPGHSASVKDIHKHSEPTPHILRERSHVLLLAGIDLRLASVLEEVFKDEFLVIHTHSHAEAFKLASSVEPDIILFSSDFEESSAIEFVRSIKAVVPPLRSEFVLIHDGQEIALKKNALKLGVYFFAQKPFDSQEIMLIIESALSKKQKEGHTDAMDNILLSILLEKNVDHKNRSEAIGLLKILGRQMSQDNFGVTHFAESAGMSRIQLFRKCTSLFGISPSELIQQSRITYARYLLMTRNDLTIAQIAFDVGFKSSSHFSKKFKQLTGTTPSQLRLQADEYRV